MILAALPQRLLPLPQLVWQSVPVPEINGLNGSGLVSVDYEGGDDPERCQWCREWYYEYLHSELGGSVLREWHRPDCPSITQWIDSSE